MTTTTTASRPFELVTPLKPTGDQPDAIVVADGTSCRHQIRDGAQREAVHVAALLARQLGA